MNERPTGTWQLRVHAQVAQQALDEVVALITAERPAIELLVEIQAARDALAALGSTAVGDRLGEQIEAVEACPDCWQRSLRRDALINLLPYLMR